MPLFAFNKKYFALTVILFVTEVMIALFARDAFVRPYVGDYLVVILLYCAARTILNVSIWQAVITVLLFSFLIELLQYFQIVFRLGLENNNIARTVIGHGFDWKDLLAYTLGAATVVVLEKLISPTATRQSP